MDFKKDYYIVLGLNRNCSKEDIKAAYRRLAKLYHPDRMPEASSTLMQEINEAYETLGDPAQRAIYDAFFAKADSIRTDNLKSDDPSAFSPVRTFERKYTVTEIEKVYMRGRIQVKFWAEALDSDGNYLRSANYRLNPGETEIFVREKDLDIRRVSPAWEDSTRVSEIFRTPVAQPVRCELQTQEGIVVYQLHLTDMRVANVELKDINKYDNQSLGTLVADVFAEVVHSVSKETSEWVTECYGRTGRVEFKVEEEWRWKRTEYYHADCSTFWSEWNNEAPISTRVPRYEPDSSVEESSGRNWRSQHQYFHWQKAARTYPEKLVNFSGCSSWFLACMAILVFVAVPALRIPLLGFLILMIALIIGGAVLSFLVRFIPGFFLLVTFGLIIAAISSVLEKSKPTNFVQRKPSYDTFITSTEIRRTDDGTDAGALSFDTLITHHIKWSDYDSNLYEVELPIRVSDVRASSHFHQQLDQRQPLSISEVYLQFDRFDKDALDLVYHQLDSLRLSRRLTEAQFANALVSCIQSIPYYLVVPHSCDADLYPDEFSRQYLRTCDTDCCIGDVGFGVRSPVEFLSDLKGDCDTRALLLYNLMRRFNYDLAIITSEHYRHAAIAVGLSDVPETISATFEIGGKKLYAWETTATGYTVGMLPERVRNLHYWKVNLVNE